jgi:hypothetical protein
MVARIDFPNPRAIIFLLAIWAVSLLQSQRYELKTVIAEALCLFLLMIFPKKYRFEVILLYLALITTQGGLGNDQFRIRLLGGSLSLTSILCLINVVWERAADIIGGSRTLAETRKHSEFVLIMAMAILAVYAALISLAKAKYGAIESSLSGFMNSALILFSVTRAFEDAAHPAFFKNQA